MKKKRGMWILVMMLLLLGTFSVTANAASYQKVTYEKTKIGNYYFWLQSDTLYFGKSKSSGKAKKLHYSSSAVTNGKTIYYAQRASGGVWVEKYNIKDSRIQSVAFLDDMDEICGLYGRKIFLGGTEKYSITYNLYSYDMDTWKVKKIAGNVRGRACYGRYLVGVPQVGAVVDVPLYVYDAKKGKLKTVEKSIWSYAVKGKTVYYVKKVSGWWASGNLKVKAYKYNLTTGKKKALTKTIQCRDIPRITAKSMTYYDKNGKKRQIKF